MYFVAMKNWLKTAQIDDEMGLMEKRWIQNSISLIFNCAAQTIFSSKSALTGSGN
jgi:hypothetical protein